MSDQKCSDLKTILYEPIAPYFAQSYITLISIVQGVALATLFYTISKCMMGTLKCDIKTIVMISSAFLIICLVWDRYVTHTQYVAWRLGPLDTVIPMVFALLQVLLVLSIELSIYQYSIFLTLIYGAGFLAYWNATRSFNRPETQRVYEEHFKCMGNDFAIIILTEIKKWEKFSQKTMLSFVAIWSCFIIEAKFRYALDWITDDQLTTLFSGINILSVLILFHYDLKRALNKSVNLKQFESIAGRF